MQESPFTFIEHFSFDEHLRREDERKNLIAFILVRFTSCSPSSDIQLVKQALESIQDQERLVELFSKASNTLNVEAFLQAVNELGV